MISPGTPEKLKTFLELNPTVPKDKVFVDDSETYETYKSMKFGKLGDTPKNLDGLGFKPPSFDFFTWVSYLANVVGLSPIRKGEEGLPEGVTLLGGTLVVGGEEVLFASADRVPGDYPAPMDVIQTVEARL